MAFTEQLRQSAPPFPASSPPVPAFPTATEQIPHIGRIPAGSAVAHDAQPVATGAAVTPAPRGPDLAAAPDEWPGR